MSKSILVIDDDAVVRRTLEKILGSAGYSVAFAETGADGLNKFTELKPDLVITDILMPEQDGVETIIRLRKFWDGPILAISGGSPGQSFDFMKLVPRLGATGTLNKPFGPDELLKAVERCLESAVDEAD